MTKPALLAQIIARLQAELVMLTAAALATHAEATDEENKAEDKYDTRGLEASYLAHGQSKAAEDAALAVAQFQALAPRDFAADSPVSIGALVVLEGHDRSHYFIGPRAGGRARCFNSSWAPSAAPSASPWFPSPDISHSARNRNHTLCQFFFRVHGCSGYPGYHEKPE